MLSLETASGWVWAIAGPQPYPDVWRAPVGSTVWTNLGFTPDRSATLLVHGPTAYVAGQEGAGPIPPSVEVYTATQAGRHLAVPCPASLPVPYAELGASTDGSLVQPTVPCGSPGTGGPHGTGCRSPGNAPSPLCIGPATGRT